MLVSTSVFSSYLETPKSPSLTNPLLPINTLRILRSLWIVLLSCKYFTAKHNWENHSQIYQNYKIKIKFNAIYYLFFWKEFTFFSFFLHSLFQISWNQKFNIQISNQYSQLLPLWAYSITIHSLYSCSKASKYLMMFGCTRFYNIFTSLKTTSYFLMSSSKSNLFIAYI